MLKKYGIPRIRFLRNVSLELSSAGETVSLKTIRIARTHEKITFGNTISSGFAKPQ